MRIEKLDISANFTPDEWGSERYIIIDIDAACKSMLSCEWKTPLIETEPGEYEGDEPYTVDDFSEQVLGANRNSDITIYRRDDGKCFAVDQHTQRGSGQRFEGYSWNIYECQDPATVNGDGIINILNGFDQANSEAEVESVIAEM